jgi:glycosyltransferase A (GT-A) superfamily protein (DUF2064 family)
MSVALLVIAKAPSPGRSKTRLCSPREAALLAEAALLDTLDAVDRAPVPGRRVLVLDGELGPWLPHGWDVVGQRGRDLAERIANAFAEVGAPALLVAMDTPQLTPALVASAARVLLEPGVGAVLGPASDGGYWAVGLREPDAAAFRGVPMSSPHTLSAQRRRLDELGTTWRELPELRDVDTFDDAVKVASLVPRSRFARALQGVLDGSLVGARP